MLVLDIQKRVDRYICAEAFSFAASVSAGRECDIIYLAGVGKVRDGEVFKWVRTYMWVTELFIHDELN